MAVKRFNQCTIFTLGKRDPFTGLQPIESARSYQCSLKRGSNVKLVDSTGSEYYPASMYWVRESDLLDGTHSEPKNGEMIAKGVHDISVTPADVGAEFIKSIMIHDHLKFGESESYTIGAK